MGIASSLLGSPDQLGEDSIPTGASWSGDQIVENAWIWGPDPLLELGDTNLIANDHQPLPLPHQSTTLDPFLLESTTGFGASEPSQISMQSQPQFQTNQKCPVLLTPNSHSDPSPNIGTFCDAWLDTFSQYTSVYHRPVQKLEELSTVPGLKLPTKRSRRDPSPTPTDGDVLEKRQRNNEAARKYRQKKIDRIKELEEQVEVIRSERDELRVQLAVQEAETAALREMLKLRNSRDS